MKSGIKVIRSMLPVMNQNLYGLHHNQSLMQHRLIYAVRHKYLPYKLMHLGNYVQDDRQQDIISKKT